MTSYHEWGRAQRAFAEAYRADPVAERPRREVRFSWETVRRPAGAPIVFLAEMFLRLLRWRAEGTVMSVVPADGDTVRFYVEDGVLDGYDGERTGVVVGDLRAGGSFVLEVGGRLVWPVAPPE